MNKENILKVADAIEQNPTHFNMQYPDMCVSGYAVNLFGTINDSPSTNTGSIHLGLNPSQAREMFFCFSMDTFRESGIETVTKATSLVPAALRWMVSNSDINWRRAFTAVMMDNALGKDK